MVTWLHGYKSCIRTLDVVGEEFAAVWADRAWEAAVGEAAGERRDAMGAEQSGWGWRIVIGDW